MAKRVKKDWPVWLYAFLTGLGTIAALTGVMLLVGLIRIDAVLPDDATVRQTQATLVAKYEAQRTGQRGRMNQGVTSEPAFELSYVDSTGTARTARTDVHYATFGQYEIGDNLTVWFFESRPHVVALDRAALEQTGSRFGLILGTIATLIGGFGAIVCLDRTLRRTRGFGFL